MIMNKHPDVLTYLDIKKKDAPDPLYICFTCFLRMPEKVYKHMTKQSPDGIKVVCSGCNTLLHYADDGAWMMHRPVDYYHKRKTHERESS